MRMPWQKKSALEIEIERLLKAIEKEKPGTDEYNALIKELQSLVSIQTRKESKWNPMIVVAAIGVVGALAQILLILNFEKTDILTTKSINFITKGRA